jgi:hypothetical protein
MTDPLDVDLGLFYDWDGNRITLREWADLRTGKDVHVAESTLLDQGKWVSTVWLGVDHGFSWNPDHPPVIFETLVFDLATGFAGDYMERYTTLLDATLGHDRIVQAIKEERDPGGE